MKMYQLERDLISTLEDEKLDTQLDSYPDDRISEMTDSHVPVYYSELAQCLVDDTSLAELEDEGLARYYGCLQTHPDRHL